MDLTPEEQQLVEEHRKKKAKEDWKPRPLESYSIEDKVKWFDEMYQHAANDFTYLKHNGHLYDDAKEYTYESVVELLSQHDSVGFWKVWNSMYE